MAISSMDEITVESVVDEMIEIGIQHKVISRDSLLSNKMETALFIIDFIKEELDNIEQHCI